MNNKAKWLAVASVAAIISIIVGVGVASAAGPTQGTDTQAYCGMGGGFRFGGAVVDEAVTKLLGMTEEQIQTLRLQGKSLVQIAATKNISEKQLVDAMMAYKKTQVQARVTAKTLTQEQANLILQQMQTMTTQAVNRTTTGPMGRQGAGNGICGGIGAGNMGRWGR
jgi:hypothetical protein